jgi:Sec-independent protein secretion pathway component TatC
MPKIKPASPDDQFTLVEHLDELRFRLIVCIAVFLVALGLCIWQSDLVLEIANRPLPDGFEPITFAVGEPFITTITVAAYAALYATVAILVALVLFQDRDLA